MDRDLKRGLEPQGFMQKCVSDSRDSNATVFVSDIKVQSEGTEVTRDSKMEVKERLCPRR